MVLSGHLLWAVRVAAVPLALMHPVIGDVRMRARWTRAEYSQSRNLSTRAHR